MKVLVCGGRSYAAVACLFLALDRVNRERGPITLVIHGDAPGADCLGRDWARDRGIPEQPFPADWDSYLGPRAGFRRNQRMIDEAKPDLVVAFPGDRGTRDMQARAKRAGIETIYNPMP